MHLAGEAIQHRIGLGSRVGDQSIRPPIIEPACLSAIEFDEKHMPRIRIRHPKQFVVVGSRARIENASNHKIYPSGENIIRA